MAREFKAGDKVTCVVEQQLPNCLIVRFQSGKGKNKARTFRGVLIDEKCSATKRAIQRKEPSQKPTLTKEATSSFIENFNSKNVSGKFLRNKKKPSCLVLDDFYIDYHHDANSNSSTESNASLEYVDQFYSTKRRRKQITKSDLEIVLPSKDQPENEQSAKREKREPICKKQGKQMQNSQKEGDSSDKTEVFSNSSSENVLKEKNGSQELGLVATANSGETNEFTLRSAREEEPVLTCSEESVKHMEDNTNSEGYFSSSDKTASFPDLEHHFQEDSENHNDLLQSSKVDEGSVIIPEELAECMATSVSNDVKGIEKKTDAITDSQETIYSEPQVETNADRSSSTKTEEKAAPKTKKEVKKRKARKPKNAFKSNTESRENMTGDAVKDEELELRQPLNFFGKSLLESCENGNMSEDNIADMLPKRQVSDDLKSTRTRKPSKRKLEAFEADAYLRGAKKRKSIKVQKYVSREENVVEGDIVNTNMENENRVDQERRLAEEEIAKDASLEVNGAFRNYAGEYRRDASDMVVAVMQEEVPVNTNTELVLGSGEDMTRVTMVQELGGVGGKTTSLGEESAQCSRIMTSPRKRLSPKKIVTVKKKTPVKKNFGSSKAANEEKLPSLENILKQKVGLSRMSVLSLKNEVQQTSDLVASKLGDEEALPDLESTMRQRIVTEDMLFCKEPAVSGQLCRDLSARERYIAKWSVLKQAQKVLKGKIKLLDASEIAPFEEAARQRELLATVKHNERSRGMTHKGKRYVLVNLKEAGVFDNITPGPGRKTVKIEVSATKNLRVPKNSTNQDTNVSQQGDPEQNPTVFKERVVAKVLGGVACNVEKERVAPSSLAVSVEGATQNRPVSLEQRQQAKTGLPAIPAKPWKDIDPTQLQQAKPNVPVTPAKPWKDIDPTQKLWKIGKKTFKALPVYIVPKKGNKKKIEGQVNPNRAVSEAVNNDSMPGSVGDKDQEAVSAKPAVTVHDEALATQKEVQRVKFYDEYTIDSPKKAKKKSPESGNKETKNLKRGTAGEGKKRQRPNKSVLRKRAVSNERGTGSSMSHKLVPDSISQNASNAFHEDEMQTESFGNLSATRLCENIGEELAQGWSELDPGATDPGETDLEFESNLRLTESEHITYDDDNDDYVGESSSSDTDQMSQPFNQAPFSHMEKCSQTFEQLNGEDSSGERGENSMYAQMSFQRLVASAHAEAMRGNEDGHEIRQGGDGTQVSLISPVFPASNLLREMVMLQASHSNRGLENDTVQGEDDSFEKSNDQCRSKSIGCKKIQNKDSLLMQALLNSHQHSMHRSAATTSSQEVLANPPNKSLSGVAHGLLGARDHVEDGGYVSQEQGHSDRHGGKDTALLKALNSVGKEGINQRADCSGAEKEIPSSSHNCSLALKIALKNITRPITNPKKPSSGAEGSHVSHWSHGIHKSPKKQNKKVKENLFKAKNISPERSSREAISGLANMERRLQSIQVKENGDTYIKGVKDTSSMHNTGNIKNLQRVVTSLQTKGTLHGEDNKRRRKSGKPKKCQTEQRQHFETSSKHFLSVNQNEIKKEVEDDPEVYTALANREQVFMESAMSERDYRDLIEQSGVDPMDGVNFDNESMKGLQHEISPRSTSPHAKVLANKNIPNEFVKAKLLQFETHKQVGASEKATHEDCSNLCPGNGKEIVIRVSDSKEKKLKSKTGTKYSRIGRRRYPTQHKGLRRHGSNQDLPPLGGASLGGQSTSVARLPDLIPCMVPIRDINVNSKGGEIEELLELSSKKNNRAREQGEELLKEMFTLNKEILSKSEPNFVVVNTNTTR